jgi:hypothetical protein
VTSNGPRHWAMWPTDLAEVGGVVQLISLESEWIETGELPEAVRLLGRSWNDVDEEHRTEATQFVVRAAALLDPIQTDDVFEAIFESEQLLVDVGKSVAAALYSLLNGDRASTFQKAVIAENLIRLSANGYFGPMRVIGLLLNQCWALGPRVQADHEGHEETGRRLVRALGLAAQYLGDGSGELESTLEELATAHEEIADDAALELGQIGIRSAVSSTQEDEARERLTEAARWLGVAESGQEYRPDAALLGVSVRHINSFCAGGRIEASDVDQVRSLAWSFIEGGIEEEPSWRTQRTESMLAWGRLVSALEKCAGLDDPAWYDPPALIAALGEAIQVQRGIGWYYRSRKATSADDYLPLMDRVLSPFMQVAERRAWVDRWLKDASGSEALPVDGVAAIRRALREDPRGPRGPDDPGKGPGRPHNRLRDALCLDEATTAAVTDILGPEWCDRLEAGLDSREQIQSAGHGLLFDNVLAKMTADFCQSPEYRAAVRKAGDMMLACILKFVKVRLDGSTGRNTLGHYLRRLTEDDDDPAEIELAEDLLNWLSGQLPGQVQTEVPGVGTGRVDIVWTWPEFRLVIECKRRKRSEARARMDGKLAQAEQYQVTDVPIGYLVVLDLFPKERLDDLPDCVGVEVLDRGGSRSHYVGTFIVQGNKPSPSSLNR